MDEVSLNTLEETVDEIQINPFNEKIDEFNKKWAGVQMPFCPLLFGAFVLWPNKITFCCSSTNDPQNGPVIIDKNLEHFSFSDFLENLGRILEEIKNGSSACNGCELLKYQVVPRLSDSNNFKGVTLNNFTRCNAKCIYCHIWENNTPSYYNALPILKKIKEEGFFDENLIVDWGGGEPLIYPEFEDIFNWCLENKLNQHINSSGLTFSDTVLRGLKENLVQLQISPDSGTKEVYSTIKGLNGFERVWSNIKRYCEYADNVTIKYIIFSLNDNRDEIISFIEKCIENGVKKICISCEWRTIWEYDPNWDYDLLSEKDLETAKLLKSLAEENGINVTISVIWGKNVDLIRTQIPFYERFDCTPIDEKVKHINYNINYVNNKLNAIDAKLNTIDAKLDAKLDSHTYMLEKIDYPERLLRKLKSKK